MCRRTVTSLLRVVATDTAASLVAWRVARRNSCALLIQSAVDNNCSGFQPALVSAGRVNNPEGRFVYETNLQDGGCGHGGRTDT
jgi:hypothetical protein